MELALTISAIIGALLFLIGYLAFVFAGFRHHFVTGIIAILPVLNIVTIPALWHKTAKKILLSILGIIIVAASWFFGADTTIKNILFPNSNSMSHQRIQNPSQNISLSSPTNNMTQQPKQTLQTHVGKPITNQTKTAKPFADIQRYIDVTDMLPLPAKALYKLSFEGVPVDKASTLNGRIIEVTMNSLKKYEGKVTKVSPSSLFLQSSDTVSIENEFPLANIKQLRLMVKKAVN